MAMQLPIVPLVRTLDAVAPSLCARLLTRLFLEPTRRPAPEWEQRIAQTADTIHLSSGHHGLSWGTGAPVLLAHGWESRVTQLGAFVAPLVARGYRVLGFYAPAHGANPERTITVFEYASFLRAIVREVGPLRGIIGHSMGAAATGFALHMGLKVDRVALISIPESVSTAARWFELALKLAPRTQRLFRQRLVDKVFHGTPLERLAVSEYAPHFKVPALLLATEDDREISAADTRRLATRWPNAQLQIFPDAGGHRKILRDRRTIEAVVNFIAAKTVSQPQLAAAVAAREAKAA